MKGFTLFLLGIVATAMLACAAPVPTPIPTATLVPTATPDIPATVTAQVAAFPTATPYPTYTPEPTATPYPTYTPEPTATPYPTHTPEPTATPTVAKVAIPTPTVALGAGITWRTREVKDGVTITLPPEFVPKGLYPGSDAIPGAWTFVYKPPSASGLIQVEKIPNHAFPTDLTAAVNSYRQHLHESGHYYAVDIFMLQGGDPLPFIKAEFRVEGIGEQCDGGHKALFIRGAHSHYVVGVSWCHYAKWKYGAAFADRVFTAFVYPGKDAG